MRWLLELLEEPGAESSTEALENLIYRQLELLGEDPTRNGLRQTPTRSPNRSLF